MGTLEKAFLWSNAVVSTMTFLQLGWAHLDQLYEIRVHLAILFFCVSSPGPLKYQ